MRFLFFNPERKRYESVIADSYQDAVTQYGKPVVRPVLQILDQDFNPDDPSCYASA